MVALRAPSPAPKLITERHCVDDRGTGAASTSLISHSGAGARGASSRGRETRQAYWWPAACSDGLSIPAVSIRRYALPIRQRNAG